MATAGDGKVVAGAAARQKGVEADCDAGEGADAINQPIVQLINLSRWRMEMQGFLFSAYISIPPGGDAGGKVEGGGEQARIAGNHPWLLLLPVAWPPPSNIDAGLEEGMQGELFASGLLQAQQAVALALCYIF